LDAGYLGVFFRTAYGDYGTPSMISTASGELDSTPATSTK